MDCNKEIAWAFKLEEDDYELDSDSVPFLYQLLCERADGYLSVGNCEFHSNNLPSKAKVGIEPDRGAGIDKFRKFLINAKDKKFRLGYTRTHNDNKIEYYFAAKFGNKPNGWPSRCDKNICQEKIELYLVKSDIYDNAKMRDENYAPLEYRQQGVYFYLSIDGFKDTETKSACVVSILSDRTMILEYVSNIEDQMHMYQESKLRVLCLPDQTDNAADSNDHKNHVKPKDQHPSE